jgi:hypothetical protein
MLTRQATKVQAKKVADAEACCDNFIASVNAMDADTWNCLPVATKARVAAAVDWTKIEDIRGVGPFGQALEQPQSPTPSRASTMDYPNVQIETVRAPSLAPTMIRAPSLAPTLLMIDEDIVRSPSPNGTYTYDAAP